MVAAVFALTSSRRVGARNAMYVNRILHIASMAGKEAGAWSVGGLGYVSTKNCGTAASSASKARLIIKGLGLRAIALSFYALARTWRRQRQ